MRRPSRSRHSRRRSTAGRSTVSQAPWNISKTSYHPFQILSEDEIESIHLASLKVLRDYGMEILDGACVTLLRLPVQALTAIAFDLIPNSSRNSSPRRR